MSKEFFGFKTAPANNVSRTLLDHATGRRTGNTFLSSRSCPFACLSYFNSVFRTKKLNEFHSIKTKMYFMYVQSLEQTPLDEDVRFMCVFFRNLLYFLELGHAVYRTQKLKKKKFGPWGVNRTCPNETVAKPLVSFKKNCCQILKLTSNYSLFLTISPVWWSLFSRKIMFLVIHTIHALSSMHWTWKIPAMAGTNFTHGHYIGNVFSSVLVRLTSASVTCTCICCEVTLASLPVINTFDFNFRPRTPTPALR